MNDIQSTEHRKPSPPTKSAGVTPVVTGALLGAVAGYLCATDRGRRWRLVVDSALENSARHVGHARRVVRVVVAALEEAESDLHETPTGRDSQSRGPSDAD
jgi:hypothetical protein